MSTFVEVVAATERFNKVAQKYAETVGVADAWNAVLRQAVAEQRPIPTWISDAMEAQIQQRNDLAKATAAEWKADL